MEPTEETNVLGRGVYRSILIEREDDGVVIATLNRPHISNKVDAGLHYELSRLGQDLDDDRTARVLVVTGAGDNFCAGGDSAGFPDGKAGYIGDLVLEAGRIVDNILGARKPIISAVRGECLGFGATLALLCDVVVAGRSAQFGDHHVLAGVGAGDGGQVIWPLLIGVNRAKYYLMTGERMDAAEADRLGLVNFVVDDEGVLDRAKQIAHTLSGLSIQAVMASKVPLNNVIKARAAQVLPLSLAMEDASMHSKEFKERRRRMLEEAAAAAQKGTE